MEPWQQIAILLLISALAIGVIVWTVYRFRRSPQERERRRRLAVHRKGRLGDAIIADVEDANLYYTYSVRGVSYTAAQDISNLREYLPAEPERLVGHAHLKYLSKNPANSILVCEEWCGLRSRSSASPDSAL